MTNAIGYYILSYLIPFCNIAIVIKYYTLNLLTNVIVDDSCNSLLHL